jgi:hypothetical protein
MRTASRRSSENQTNRRGSECCTESEDCTDGASRPLHQRIHKQGHDCSVSAYKFKIGQLVYFHPKGTGRSQVDAAPERYQTIKRLPVTDMRVNFSMKLEALSKITIEWQERASKRAAVERSQCRCSLPFATCAISARATSSASRTQDRAMLSQRALSPSILDAHAVVTHCSIRC